MRNLIKTKISFKSKCELKVGLRNIGLLFSLFISSLFSQQAMALKIKDVTMSQSSFNPAKGEQVTIHYSIDKSAEVILRWYEGRELLIREQNLGVVKSGSHQASWDGKDHFSKRVPAEAYHFTLTGLVKGTGETITYDLSDVTGRKDLDVANLKWDPKSHEISYVLSLPARVNIRVGLDDHGPLLKTILDWVPRAAGEHREIWDGMDASKVMDLSAHPLRLIGGQAFSLPKNTVFILPKQTSVNLMDNKKWQEKRQVNKKSRAKRMHAHVQQSIESRGDYIAKLILPEKVLAKGNKLPEVSGNVAVRLDVDKLKRNAVVSRRFEVAFYVDGQYIFESEVGFLPMTFHWDTSLYPDGEHYLTANIFGYEGNLGMVTLKVDVKNR